MVDAKLYLLLRVQGGKRKISSKLFGCSPHRLKCMLSP